MRILFIGSVIFSAECLKFIIGANANVIGICTLKESAENSDHYDLSKIAQQHKINYLHVGDINSDETYAWIKNLNPDIIFCFGWSRLIKKRLLVLAPLGVVGYHPAELPKNRGRHPIIWALALGLSKTASTFFFMDEGADSGPIISQISIDIDGRDTAQTLYNKITKTAIDQIETFLPKLSSGELMPICQEEISSNYWRKRSINDGLIDWRMSAESIYNLVRALARPYPGAHFMLDGKFIKVWSVSPHKFSGENIEPGKVLSLDAGLILIKCGDGGIELLETEPRIELSRRKYI